MVEDWSMYTLIFHILKIQFENINVFYIDMISQKQSHQISRCYCKQYCFTMSVFFKIIFVYSFCYYYFLFDQNLFIFNLFLVLCFIS